MLHEILKNKIGFVPTIKQMAEIFGIPNHEAKAAIEQLKESGRIKITDMGTILKFV